MSVVLTNSLLPTIPLFVKVQKSLNSRQDGQDRAISPGNLSIELKTILWEGRTAPNPATVVFFQPGDDNE